MPESTRRRKGSKEQRQGDLFRIDMERGNQVVAGIEVAAAPHFQIPLARKYDVEGKAIKAHV